MHVLISALAFEKALSSTTSALTPGLRLATYVASRFVELRLTAQLAVGSVAFLGQFGSEEGQIGRITQMEKTAKNRTSLEGNGFSSKTDNL